MISWKRLSDGEASAAIKGQTNSIYPNKKWALVVFLLPVVVYLNSLKNPFQYDDFHSIANNPHIRRLANVPQYFTDPTLFSERAESAMYRPVLLSSFALNYAVSSREPWSYHLINVGLHGLNALLVFGICQALTKTTMPSLLAALVFGTHPINSEAVNYISSRSELLAAFFFLLALRFSMQRASMPSRLIGIGVAYAGGLLSKSIVIVFPAVLFIHDYLARLRITWRQAVATYLLLTAIAAAYLVVVWKFVYKASLGAPVRGLQEQLWTQSKAFVFYLKLLALPTGLSVDHQFLISDSLFDPITGMSLIFLLSLAFVVFNAMRSRPAFLFCLSWFLIILAPSSLIPLNVLINEHRLYLPSVAFAILSGFALWRFNFRQSKVLACMIIPVALIGLFGWTTMQRNHVWSSAYALWSNAAAKAPLMARPHIFLGEYNLKNGNQVAAKMAFTAVLERDPNYGPAYIRLAELSRAEGNGLDAVEILERGVELLADNADLCIVLGEQYRLEGDLDASLDAYLNAVDLVPTNPGLRNNLGNVYQLLNRPEEALVQHLQAVELDSTDSRSWLNAGNAYQGLDAFGNAEAAYANALDLSPEYLEAWLNLAGLYSRMGRANEAKLALRKAAAIKRDQDGKSAQLEVK